MNELLNLLRLYTGLWVKAIVLLRNKTCKLCIIDILASQNASSSQQRVAVFIHLEVDIVNLIIFQEELPESFKVVLFPKSSNFLKLF